MKSVQSEYCSFLSHSLYFHEFSLTPSGPRREKEKMWMKWWIFNTPNMHDTCNLATTGNYDKKVTSAGLPVMNKKRGLGGIKNIPIPWSMAGMALKPNMYLLQNTENIYTFQRFNSVTNYYAFQLTSCEKVCRGKWEEQIENVYSRTIHCQHGWKGNLWNML